MKNDSFLKFLINPFTRIAGWQALFLGLLFVALSGFIGGTNNLWFDGVLDAHAGGKLPCWWGFVFLAVDVLVLTLVIWGVSLIVTKGFRFIDLFGTLTLARAPMLLIAIAAVFIDLPTGKSDMTVQRLFFVFISLMALIWYVTLIYQAIKVSTGATGARLVIITIIGILTAEFVSKVAIISLTKNLLRPLLA